MYYNGKRCEGECSSKPDEVKYHLEDYYEYNFQEKCYICKECGDRKPDEG